MFPNWHHLIEAAKATEPTEWAFQSGLVVGIDRKEAADVPSSLKAFLRDERLVAFVRSEFERAHPKPWNEDLEAEWDELGELVYYRALRTVPNTLEEAWERCQEDFFYPPRYLRLRGKVEEVFPEEDGNV